MKLAARVVAVALVLAFVVMLLAACSALKVDGDCTYTREIRTSYHCEPGSSLEHRRLTPGTPEP